MTLRTKLPVLVVLLLGATGLCDPADSSGIHPSARFQQYWSYDGKEILLLGGSEEDNLFQTPMPELVEQLDLLKAAGGNYVRNTMSSRDPGNLWPFARREDGMYDLDTYNDEYWNRFERFLEETARRDIVAQIEVWATFDFYRDNWDINPFNPKNNRQMGQNWGDGNWSKLPTVVDSHPVFTENNFFRSVPDQMALHRPLYYQQRYVDKLLSISLQHDHVLYCMDNETSVNADWGRFWANYIKKAAKLQGASVYCTEMWDPHDLDHAFHYETFDHPEIYDFVDISQNNHKTGQQHWDNCLAQFQRLTRLENLRPVNNIKVYGSDGGRFTSEREGIENFIQNVFAGCASARFHRPPSGLGLNETAQLVVKSVREATDKFDWFSAAPRNELLAERHANEAYCRALPGEAYAVYFPNGGKVDLDVGSPHDLTLQWLSVLDNRWSETERAHSDEGRLALASPSEGHWICIVTTDAAQLRTRS